MIEAFKKLNLLYIEDNMQTRLNYEKSLKLVFNEVYSVSNFQDAINIYDSKVINLLLVDIELSDDKNGFDLANQIRQEDTEVPIIFLSGYSNSDYLLKAINSNINGYIVKPLDLNKLFKVISRFFGRDDENVTFNNFTYNVNTLELLNKDNEKVILGKKENRLLHIFIRNKNRTLSREELEFEIWDEPLSSDSTLKNLIASLRKKIGKKTIINESKLGWRIKLD